MANSEDQDEMPHKVAFHLGLHCLLTQNRSSEQEYNIFFKKFILLMYSLKIYTGQS